jgi:pyruvate kinase
MKSPELLVTLSPSFSHFERFVNDPRIAGVRFNTAMTDMQELEKEFEILANVRRGPLPMMKARTPIYYDVKGRQLRITEVGTRDGNLELTLNHPIEVKTPCVVLFKAGADEALLDHVDGDGKHLAFQGGPRYNLVSGESLHIKGARNKAQNIFTETEAQKIELAKRAGVTRYFLSYVEGQDDIEQLRDVVGRDTEIWLKIENNAGLHFVDEHFKKEEGLALVAARGDLFVELDKPHYIAYALRRIIEVDPEACVGSRILLSVVDSPVPSCADLLEISWLYDTGYRKFMLCDELCLKENLLGSAVSVFEGIKYDL